VTSTTHETKNQDSETNALTTVAKRSKRDSLPEISEGIVALLF
jgi:hypothetical protein